MKGVILAGLVGNMYNVSGSNERTKLETIRRGVPWKKK